MELRPIADELLDEYFRLSPVHATEIGIHEHDGLWPDLSNAGREQHGRFLRSAQEREDEELQHAVQSAARSAVEAVDAYVEWLRDELLAHATGDFRLGRDLHDHKFRHALKTEITPDQLKERAEASFDELRGQM